MRKVTMQQAINEALDEELARDPKVFYMGEDVGGKYGGLYGCTQGLAEKYGSKRVFNTPLSEQAIIGTAIGAAQTGMRPVAEIMLSAFMCVAFDEIRNQLASTRYACGGQVKMAVTIPTVTGSGKYGGHTHTWSPEGVLINIPGIKIVIPSTPYDAKGLLKSAIRDDNPKIFLEHRNILTDNKITSEIPDGEYLIPLGKADIKRKGKDVTVVATALMVFRALSAAEKLKKEGIDVEIVDPRTLVPLDKEAILKSVGKTGRLVITTDESKTGSAAGEIAAIIAEEGLDLLKKPIKRVCAPDTPPPSSPTLEENWTPSEARVIEAVKSLMG